MYVNTYMVQALDDAVEVVGAVCEVLQLVHGASEVRSEPMELVLQDLRLCLLYTSPSPRDRG